MTISFLLVIIALVLLFLAAIGIPAGRVSLAWMGMFCWLLSTVIR